MLLAIDAGNTHIAAGIYEKERMLEHWRISTGSGRTEDEYGMAFLSLIRNSGMNPEDVNGAVIASVVPPLTPILEKTVSKHLKTKPLVVGPGTKTGVNINYENPKEVGPDHIAHSVAAIHKYGTPAVVIDFGTATTLDAISNKGEYLGGIVAPGILTSLDALHEGGELDRAFQTPQDDRQVKHPEHAIGDGLRVRGNGRQPRTPRRQRNRGEAPRDRYRRSGEDDSG